MPLDQQQAQVTEDNSKIMLVFRLKEVKFLRGNHLIQIIMSISTSKDPFMIFYKQ